MTENNIEIVVKIMELLILMGMSWIVGFIMGLEHMTKKYKAGGK